MSHTAIAVRVAPASTGSVSAAAVCAADVSAASVSVASMFVAMIMQLTGLNQNCELDSRFQIGHANNTPGNKQMMRPPR